LNISNAKLSHLKKGNRVFIDYTLDEINYYLIIKKNDKGQWCPSFINHYKNMDEGTRICPLCKKRLFLSSCNNSKEYLNSIYQNLINMPTVKVRALFAGLVIKEGEQYEITD